MDASRVLDRKLGEWIEESRMPNKFDELVSMVDVGSKELEGLADDLMQRLAVAMPRGRDNMAKMRVTVEKLEKKIETIEQFNQRMSNSPPED